MAEDTGPGRTNAVTDDTIPGYVAALKAFLGAERIERAQQLLDEELRHHGLARRYLLMDRRPWQFVLRDYDNATRNGQLVLPSYPVEFQLLAGDGLKLSTLAQFMPQATRDKYAQDLLLDTHLDFMHELRVAWQYYLLGFDLAWYPPGQERGPEFRVIGQGLDFNVECRRFWSDYIDRVKSPAVADTCDALYALFETRSLWGEVELEIQPGFRFDVASRKPWHRALRAALEAGARELQLNDALTVRWEFRAEQSPEVSQAELARSVVPQPKHQWNVLYSKRRGEVAFEPIVFRCRGPKRTPNAFRDDLYAVLRDKVHLQLPGDRAGVLSVQFEGISDPRVFVEAEGVQAIVGRLFQQAHLAAVILRCDDTLEVTADAIISAAPAVVFRNPNTAFPAVSALRHLG